MATKAASPYAQWLEENPLRVWMNTQHHFRLPSRICKRCSVSRMALSTWLKGTAYPTPGHIQVLTEMTDGAVTYEAFREWQRRKTAPKPVDFGMQPKRVNHMGRFAIEIEVSNNDDLALVRRGFLRPDQVRRQTVQGVVDSGAAKLVLPQAVVKQLGLAQTDKIKVRYADGRTAQRHEAEGAFVELLGRHGTFTAIVEPKRKTALVGAIVLEDLDLLVDCHHQRVVPRDPRGAVYEIE
jgi:predicted aspartyl protease